MTQHSGLDLVLDFLLNGVTHATGWQILLFTLAVTHVTIAAVTIFLHRCQAHRAKSLFPLLVMDDDRHGDQRVGCHSP